MLPEVDDELRALASEFDTLADLRADIEGRVREALDEQIDAAFRAAAVDALVDARRTCRPPGPLVETRARELLDGFVRSLGDAGARRPRTTSRSTGQTPELLVAQIRAEAAQSVARELALEAVADKAGIDVSDDEVKDAHPRAGRGCRTTTRTQMIADIWAHGHQEALRDDLRLRAALDRLAADVKPISTEPRDAREKLWTPDKEKHRPREEVVDTRQQGA